MTNATVLAGANLGSDGLLGGTGAAADTFGAGTIGTLHVSGAINSSSFIGAGVNPTDGTFGNGNDTSAGTGLIKTIFAKSADSTTRFESSAFGIARLPAKVVVTTDPQVYRPLILKRPLCQMVMMSVPSEYLALTAVAVASDSPTAEASVPFSVFARPKLPLREREVEEIQRDSPHWGTEESDVAVGCLPPATIERLEDRRHLSSVVQEVALQPPGLSPQQVSQAYGFNQVHFISPGNERIPGNGAGQTIAIVTAFRDPTIAADLRVFDKQFGLPNNAARGGFALSIVMPQGRPAVDGSWAQETSLDVEWAHAMAPAARIVLVEVKNDSPQNLFKGVDYARRRPGVTVVSMSFGWDNGPTGVAYQKILSTPANHIGGLGRGDGVTFVEAGSDDGVSSAFPGPSVNVVSVGGTTLQLDSAGNYASETPLAASNAPATVAYDADPNSGFAVYDSIPAAGVQGWQVAGGTSAGAPQWAAIFAIADQGRALHGRHSLDTAATLPALASLPSADFHPVITNGGANMGRGSPNVASLVADLVHV